MASAGREALKRLGKKQNKTKKKHRELVILICSALTKTVQKEQNTSGLITTGGNSSFKCAFLWQYQTGKANTIERISPPSLTGYFISIASTSRHKYEFAVLSVYSSSLFVFL